jgi:sugar fermentation stimulation protein A
VQHTGIEKVKIAEHIDPDYALAVAEARRRGVEILAYRCSIDQKKIVINQEVSIDF